MSRQLKNNTGERKLRVTLLSTEWKASSNGDLTTINRELAIQMAKHPNVEVSVFLPQCSEEDKRDADSYNVKLIEAVKLFGFEPVDWLASLPDGHAMDCVLGHGVALGRQIQIIKKNPNYRHCKWIQVVHTAPEEIGMYKSISEGQQMQKTVIELCEMADQVVTIGPKLTDAYKHQLRKQDVFNLMPSIFTEFSDVQQASYERRKFCVLVTESGDSEDFDVKGYGIAAKAIANLKGEPYQLKFASKQRGKEDELKQKLLQCGIDPNQLIICSFDENKKTSANLFSIVDIAILPSKTEGFGLSALKAISAGLPVLVSRNSGIAEALREVPNGSYRIVNSEDPADWARAIKAVCDKKRNVRLAEAKILREHYLQQFSWEESCDVLVKKMFHLAFGTSPSTLLSTSGQKRQLEVRHSTVKLQEKKGMLPLPGSSTFDPEEELEEPSMKLQRMEGTSPSTLLSTSGHKRKQEVRHSTVKLQEKKGTSPLIVVPITGHEKKLEEPSGRKGKMASAVAPSFRSTKETSNYAQLCRLLVDVSAHIFRETFDKRRPRGELIAVLSSPPVREVLQSLRRKRILSRSQWTELYPTIKSAVSSTRFDIPLLMVLLRNICGLVRPTNGWDTLPPAADTTLEADIVRIKCYRNTVYGHASEAFIDDPTFNKYWQDIQDALVRLGGAGYQSAIHDLKEENMDPDFEVHYKELLKQCIEDEVSIKETMDEIGRSPDELKEAVVNPKKRAGDKGTSPPSDMFTTGREKEQEELTKTMRLQERKEFYTTNNKISVWRSKITEEGGVLMVQNVPSRVMIPPKALPTCTEVTCFLWNLQILSPPLGRNEALVSSVMELGRGSLPGTEKRYEFNVKVKLALSHSASDIKGYELVIKELTNEKTNDWRDLETRWAWTPSDIKDEHSGVEEFPDWLFPFAEAEITSFSSFAVVWRLKSFMFKNPSTLSSSFPCIPSDHPGVSVTFPESSLPTGQTFALTVKVQEVPCSNAKLKERLVAGPILHVSPSEPVQLLAPARLTIPVILGVDIPTFPDYLATDIRIFCRNSEENEREWSEVTEQLENIAVLENGTVTFTVNHFLEYWVWIDPLKRSFAILKNLADDLCRKLMLQQVGLCARLCARGNPPNYMLTLCCFPLHLKEQVYTLSPVCAQGEGDSLKPLCKADRISVSLSKAFTLMQEENLDNFLTFLGTESFERSLPVSVSDLSNLQVELYMGNQSYRETLCTLYFEPTVPDQTSSSRYFPSTAQVAMPEQKEDQVKKVALEFGTSFPSPKALEETVSSISSKEVLNVTILADEWNSLKSGLSTFNRELAIHLASRSDTAVTVLVPHGACREEEKAAAAKNFITIIEAEELIACSSFEGLFFPPKDLGIDVVIGHGLKLGQQAQKIRQSHNCKWLQVVHTAPDELSMCKDYPNAVTQSGVKNKFEVSLCKLADLVMAVGPKLKGFYSNQLRSFNKDQDVVEFTPGIVRDLTNVKQSLNENDEFQVLMFGRGDDEDFELKGYDIAAGAFASHELKNDSYHLTFVGAAPEKQDAFGAKILQHGVSKNQLSVEENIEDKNRLKELLLRMDLVIMPSRTKGFGLSALEALSAGLPVLAGHNSGFSKALQKVEFGELCVVNSDNPEDWSKAIKKVCQKERKKRLKEMQRVRESYRQKYKWAEQCEILVREMRRKVFA